MKQWYDYFGVGKIMGLKCTACDGYEFPPVPICSSCAGTDLHWTEMSGRGTMTSFRSPLVPEEAFASSWPYSTGMVALDEGPTYGGMVLGVGPTDVSELYELLPIPVVAEIQDRGDYQFIAFRIDRS